MEQTLFVFHQHTYYTIEDFSVVLVSKTSPLVKKIFLKWHIWVIYISIEKITAQPEIPCTITLFKFTANIEYLQVFLCIIQLLSFLEYSLNHMILKLNVFFCVKYMAQNPSLRKSMTNKWDNIENIPTTWTNQPLI